MRFIRWFKRNKGSKKTYQKKMTKQEIKILELIKQLLDQTK
jgi:hypothetical protein